LTMTIRPETTADYAAIADLHARAFGHRAGEALIVALHRQRAAFDPDLSLVAEEEGRVVGHVLFSPHRLRLLDQDVRAVNLAPIAVEPASQGRGIGGRLIGEGHTVAAGKGYAISFLLGHTSYYPRFGYRTHAFGAARTTAPMAPFISPTGATPPTGSLEWRDLTPTDVPGLRALWQRDEARVDFALDPGQDLLDWLSSNPAVRASVYVRGANIVGYTRGHAATPTSPRVFLAWDGATARAMARAIAHGAAANEVVLPIHPASAAAAGFVAPVCEAWASAMACSLAPNALDEYLAQVREGRRPPGRPIWPVAFDLE
jgi:putative acetyltransferase